MELLTWFDSRDAEEFGRTLAAFIVEELKGELGAKDKRYKAKAEKVFVKAARRVQEFRKKHALNVYKRSRVANAFLWTLKDAGCASDYADEMTQWLTVRL